MSKVTIKLLKSCAGDLQKIRARLPDTLEPGVVVQLESVIKRLERCDAVVDDRTATSTLIDDGLKLLGRLSEVFLVVAEMFDRRR